MNSIVLSTMDTSPIRENSDVATNELIAVIDALVRCSFDPMIVMREDGSIVAANDAAALILEMSIDELRRQKRSAFLNKDAFLTLVPANVGEQYRSGELSISTSNGSVFLANVRVAKVLRSTETFLGLTFRKCEKPSRPEFEKLDSVDRALAAFDQVPIPISLTSLPELTLTGGNRAFFSTFGFDPKVVIGRPTSELNLSNQESRDRVLEELARFGRVRNAQVVHVARGQQPRIFSLSIEPYSLDGVPHIITFALENTSPLSAEQIVQASEERLSDFVRNAPLSMALFDQNMNFIAHSHRFLEEFRFPPTSLEGTCLYDAFPDLPEEIKAVHRRCLAGASESSEETPLPFEDGTMDWYRWEMTPWHNQQGEIGGVAFFSQRITELKLAKERIANQERLLADVIDGSPAFISAFDREGRIMFANAAAAQAMRVPKEKLVGALAADYLPDLQSQNFLLRHKEVLDTGAPLLLETSLPIPGGPIAVLAARYPLRDTAGTVYGTAAIMTDISRQKQVEAELRRSEGQTRDALAALEKALEITRKTEEKLTHAQKMEAVGRLAGGIAHDFNNLLTVILGNSGEVLAGLRQTDPLHEVISEIEKAGQRAAGLTRQLLAFSRKQVLEPRIVNVNELIVSAEKMLRRIVGEDIEVTLLLDPRPQFCKLDKGQFEQVLMNLVVNARDAMVDGGRLTIETANVLLDASYVEDHPDASPGEHVRITVSDTGAGIPRDVQAHIFEPFFTTKGSGGGTGLGLSTAYGIVRQSGGTIWLYSEQGQGTTFKIFFPRQTDGVRESTPSFPAISTKRGKETILIVEDDEQVRATVAGILRRAGYHVISAVNGGEALLICEQHGATIHLLLTDVVMPKINGRKLAERLLQIRPQMRVLFMSGYTENVVVHHGILDANFNFLPKPITADALLTKVREVLEQVR